MLRILFASGAFEMDASLAVPLLWVGGCIIAASFAPFPASREQPAQASSHGRGATAKHNSLADFIVGSAGTYGPPHARLKDPDARLSASPELASLAALEESLPQDTGSIND